MHGLYSLDRLRQREWTYGLPPDRVADVLAACDREGYGYADYPGQADYGVAVATPDWMKARLPETGEWERLHVNPRAWNDHHDVYSATRGGGGRTPPGMLQTGERFLPEMTGAAIAYEHWHRYQFAAPFCRRCGAGRGVRRGVRQRLAGPHGGARRRHRPRPGSRSPRGVRPILVPT